MDDAHAPPPPGPLPVQDLVPPLALCLFLLAGALFMGFAQVEPDSDEPVYLAMAEAWARDGQAPHADFFLAHPPGLIAPAAALFAAAPPSVSLARVVPVLSTLALFFLVLACARQVERAAALPGTTIFAAVLFVTSPLVHLVGASYLGLDLAAAIVLGAVLASLRGRPGTAGFLLGLSLSVRLMALPLLPLFAWFHRREPSYLLGAGLGALPLIGCLLFWPGCFDQVVLYHLGKDAMFWRARMDVLARFLYEEKFLLLLAALALLWLRDGLARRLLLAGAVLVLFAAAQKVVWPYYFHLAVPFLAVSGAAALARGLRGRIEGRALVVPNLILLVVAGLLNLFVVSPRYRDDRTLEPLAEKAFALAGPRGSILDLSGGGKHAFLACTTDLRVAGGLFDMSLHRFRPHDLDEERLVAAVAAAPDLVLTEMEGGGRTVLWSRIPQVRDALLGRSGGEGFRAADVFLRRGGRSLVVLWVPALRGEPSPPPDPVEGRPGRWRFLARSGSGGGAVLRQDREGDYGMGDGAVLEEARSLPAGPGLLVARGAFSPPAPGLWRWRAEDERDGRAVTSRVWAQPGGDRLLVETSYDGPRFEPLSFADGAFDPVTGRLRSLRVFEATPAGTGLALLVEPARDE